MGICNFSSCEEKITKFFQPFGCVVLLLLRLYIGWGFVMAGWGKWGKMEQVAGFFADLGIPFATASAYLVGTVEIVGGALLLLGLFSRLAAFPLAITMVVAYLTAHFDVVQTIFSNPKAFIAEDAFLYLLTCLLVLSFGPGFFSLDQWVRKKGCRS